MKSLVTSFVFGAIVSVAACGPSAQQACQDYANAFCERTYSCDTGAQLAFIQAQFGATVDDCKATQLAKNNCAGAVSTCPAGTNYDTGAAETCVANYQAASCSDISNPSFVVPGCSTSDVCH